MSEPNTFEPWSAEDIMNGISDAFFALDNELRFVHFNMQAAEFTGLDLRDVRGKPIWDVFPAIRGTAAGNAIEQALATQSPQSFEALSTLRPGRWVQAHVRPSPKGIALYFVDITEQKLTQAREKESMERLKLIVDSVPILIGYVDKDMRYGFANKAYEHWFKLSPEQLIGHHVLDILGEETFSRVESRLQQGLAGQAFGYEAELTFPDGIPRHVSINYVPDIAADGTVRGIIGIGEDISNRKLAEAGLRQSERLAKFLVTFGDAIRPLTDPDEIMAVSARLLGEHLGADRCVYAEIEEDENHLLLRGNYTAPGVESAVGRYTLSDFGPEASTTLRAGQPYIVEDAETDLSNEAYLAAYRQITIRAAIAVPLRKKGTLVAAMAVHMARQPRKWTDDEIGLMQLITDRCWESIERARVLRTLGASENRFRIMADSAPVLIWLADATRAYTWFNKPWLDYTGRTMEQELGYGWAEGVHPDDMQRCLDTYIAAFDRRQTFTMEYRLRNRAGDYHWVLNNGTPLFNETGSFIGYIGSCVDIHDRKIAEQEREELLIAERAARTEAERANRLKDEFLSTLSHELRTPLNAMLGWSEMMRSGELAPEDVQMGLEVINRNVRAQTQIVDDLLDMNRIISGRIRLEVQRTDVSEIIDAVLESIHPAADARHIRLTRIIDSASSPIMGDPGRLQQIIWNLLTNAVKFTPKDGKIQVIMRRTDSHVEIVVSDTGEGIAPADLPHIFERFRQVDSSTTRRHGGLGLGLAIVKSLTELHGGSVHVASPGLGKGTTFTLRLPVAAVAAEMEAEPVMVPQTPAEHSGPQEMPSLAGINILAIDDDDDSRDVIQRVLQSAGATVIIAASAAEGLIILNDKRPDVILCDIGMPGMDGYQFIREVRKRSPEEGGKLPAIALTAFARSQDRRQAFTAGFQAHIAKPAEPGELIALVASLAVAS